MEKSSLFVSLYVDLLHQKTKIFYSLFIIKLGSLIANQLRKGVKLLYAKTCSLSLPVIAKVLEEDLDKPVVTPYLINETEVEKFETV